MHASQFTSKFWFILYVDVYNADHFDGQLYKFWTYYLAFYMYIAVLGQIYKHKNWTFDGHIQDQMCRHGFTYITYAKVLDSVKTQRSEII